MAVVCPGGSAPWQKALGFILTNLTQGVQGPAFLPLQQPGQLFSQDERSWTGYFFLLCECPPVVQDPFIYDDR